MELQDYNPPTWNTQQGVAKKLKRVSKRGIPSLMNAKRLTLTVDRNKFENELQAMLSMLDQWPKFVRSLSNYYVQQFSKPMPAWAMWIEFHADGWPHFHCDWLCRHSLGIEWWCNDFDYFYDTTGRTDFRLGVFTRLWKLGNVHCSVITRHRDRYAFKYAFKPEGNTDNPDNEGQLPSWLMNAKWTVQVPVKQYEDILDENGCPLLRFGKPRKKLVTVKDSLGNVVTTSKTKTFYRLRMWRTSKDFYKEPYVAPPVRPTFQLTSEFPRTLKQHWQESLNKVLVVVRDCYGKYQRSSVVTLSRLAGHVISDAYLDTASGKSFPNKFGVVVDGSFLESNIDKSNTLQIQKICLLRTHQHQIPQQQWIQSPFKPILQSSCQKDLSKLREWS